MFSKNNTQKTKGSLGETNTAKYENIFAPSYEWKSLVFSNKPTF